jgi:16S rRNA pseudouridine516 synthase
MPRTRLDRWLKDRLGCSRADATTLIRQGRVTRGGLALRSATDAVSDDDELVVDGRPVEAPPAHLLLHKPAGVVTSTSDRDGPPVTGLLPPALARFAWMPVGRLDRDTTGLLLLTRDGELCHRLTHPNHKVAKTYAATLDAPVPDDAQARFAAGLALSDGPTLPAELAVTGARTADVTLREGRFHQVKRMFHAVGREVLALHRRAMGPLTLPDDLPPGAIRPLTGDEIAAIYAAVRLEPPR